jgi:hypothetical protein
MFQTGGEIFEQLRGYNFVKGDFIHALKNQEYIANKIKVGDPLIIELVNKKYYVKHMGNEIGLLSEDLVEQLSDIAHEYVSNSNTPPYLAHIYVKNIITIPMSKKPNDLNPYFRESKFWLGVEMSGFPKIDWHYNNINKK